MLDDLEGSVNAGGFGEGFHGGILPLMAVDYLDSIYVSKVRGSSIRVAECTVGGLSIKYCTRSG